MPASTLDSILGTLVPIGVVVFIVFTFYAKKPAIFQAIGRFFKRMWEYIAEGSSSAQETTTELTFK